MTEKSHQNQSTSLSDSGKGIIEGRLRADGLEGDIDLASGVGQPSRLGVHRVSGAERQSTRETFVRQVTHSNLARTCYSGQLHDEESNWTCSRDGTPHPCRKASLPDRMKRYRRRFQHRRLLEAHLIRQGVGHVRRHNGLVSHPTIAHKPGKAHEAALIVFSPQTSCTAPAPVFRLNDHALPPADSRYVGSQFNHRAAELVAYDEWRSPSRQRMYGFRGNRMRTIDILMHVAATDAACRHPDADFARCKRHA